MILLIPTTFLSGIAMADGCNYHQQVTMTDNKPVLMFQLDDMKLMKYTTSKGNVLYIIKNNEDETLERDLSQDQLAARYPEMAQKLEG